MKAVVVGFVWLWGCIGASDVDCVNNPSAEVCAGRDGLESLFQSNKPILESLNLAQNDGLAQEGGTKKHCWDIDCGALQRDHKLEEQSHGWCEDVSDRVSKDYFQIASPENFQRRWITRTSLDLDAKPFGKYYCETDKFEKIETTNVKLNHKFRQATADFNGDLVVEDANAEEKTGIVARTAEDKMWFMWITDADTLKQRRKVVADALGALRYWKHCLSVCCVADGCWRFMQRPQYKHEKVSGNAGYNFYWQKDSSDARIQFPNHYAAIANYGETKGPGLWKYPQQYCYEQNSQYVFCPYNHRASSPVNRPPLGSDDYATNLKTNVDEFFTKQLFNNEAESTFFNLCCQLPQTCACLKGTDQGAASDAECATPKYAHATDWMNAGVEIEWPATETDVHALSNVDDTKAEFLRMLYEDKLWGAAESFTIHPRHHDYNGRGRDLDR